MTSEQECPLCGKEMYYDSDDELYDCQTQSCFLMGKELFDYELKDLSSQISRIKETAFKEGCLKAKQEVFDSLENMKNKTINRFCRCEAYGTPKIDCEHCEYLEIKKKHGVE